MFGLSGRQIFFLLVFGALIFAGTQYIPSYIAKVQFEDFVGQEVKFATTNRKTPDQVRTAVLQKAGELGIPNITKNDVRITRKGPSFTLDLEIRIPINLRVYQHDLVFQVSESGEVFENASR